MTQGVGCCFIQEHVYAPVTVVDQGEHCFLKDMKICFQPFGCQDFSGGRKNVRISPFIKAREATLGRSQAAEKGRFEEGGDYLHGIVKLELDAEMNKYESISLLLETLLCLLLALLQQKKHRNLSEEIGCLCHILVIKFKKPDIVGSQPA